MLGIEALAILKDGEAIGYISTGGCAHHVGRLMAMGYVAAAHVAAGSQLEVEILGEMRAAVVLGAPFYDADGDGCEGRCNPLSDFQVDIHDAYRYGCLLICR